MMRPIFFASLLLILIFNACKEAKPIYSLEGDWIQAGQYLITDQDTVWQRQAYIWEFNADSSANIYQFQLQKELKATAQGIRWQLEHGKIKLETANATEYWQLILLNQDSLIVEASQNAQKIQYLFRRMQIPPEEGPNQNIQEFFQDNLLSLKASAYNNSTPLEWEAIGHHFIHPNLPQSWYLPLRWGIIDYKGQSLLGLQAILSGQVNQWEILEINNFDGNTATGRYFKKGKAEQMEFKRLEARNAMNRNQLIGQWQGDNPIQKLTFDTEGQYQLKTSERNTEGPYWISKAVPLIYLQNGFQFQYLKVDSLSTSELKAELYSSKIRGQKIQFEKVENLQ
jgi:hypothetical protein